MLIERKAPLDVGHKEIGSEFLEDRRHGTPLRWCSLCLHLRASRVKAASTAPGPEPARYAADDTQVQCKHANRQIQGIPYGLCHLCGLCVRGLCGSTKSPP